MGEISLESSANALERSQRQRVAITTALVRNPEILVTDKVTLAIDADKEKTNCRVIES
jgi:ABC-type methionine transport system ATPase subunit